MDKTLFFTRDLFFRFRNQGTATQYDDYWWTFPDAEDAYAPDWVDDPFAQQPGEGQPQKKVPRFFAMLKTRRDSFTAAVRNRNLFTIPGVDWTTDINDTPSNNNPTFAGVTYSNVFTFIKDRCHFGDDFVAPGRRSFYRQFSEFINHVCGKTWWISVDDDRWFMRRGRVEAQPDKVNQTTLTVTADCDAWKYEKYSSQDLWQWNDFDFEYGIIREIEDYTLEIDTGESKYVDVYPRFKPESVYLKAEDDDTLITAAFILKTGTVVDSDDYTISSSAWSETSLIPTETKYTVKITNKDNVKRTVYVYYRGAMR